MHAAFEEEEDEKAGFEQTLQQVFRLSAHKVRAGQLLHAMSAH